METKENKSKKIGVNKKNGIAFIIFSLGFLCYWTIFLANGIINDNDNYTKYLVWTVIEILVNSVMLFVAIRSMKDDQKYLARNNFTFIWMLLCAATFPLPFAFVFGLGSISSLNIMNNIIASISTPTTILCLLALAFSCSAYAKLSEPKIHNSFLYLAVCSLMIASIYWMIWLLAELSFTGNSELKIGNIYLYIFLDFLYFFYTVYGVRYVRKSSVTYGSSVKILDPKNQKSSLIHALLIAFLGYSLLNVSVGCYSLAASYFSPNDFIDLRFGNAKGPILIGDQLFCLITSITMLSYSFVALKEERKGQQILNIEGLMTCLILNFLIPGLLGGYSYVVTFTKSAEFLVPEIIIQFGFVTFVTVAIGTIITALGLEKNYKTLSALFVVITAFMLLGASIFNLAGVIYAWASNAVDWFLSLIKIILAFIDFALAVFITIAMMREFPAITTQEKMIESVSE